MLMKRKSVWYLLELKRIENQLYELDLGIEAMTFVFILVVYKKLVYISIVLVFPERLELSRIGLSNAYMGEQSKNRSSEQAINVIP